MDVTRGKLNTFGVASFVSDTSAMQGTDSSSNATTTTSTVDDLTDDELVVFSSPDEVKEIESASTFLQLPDNFGDRITDQESLRAVFLVYRRPTLFGSRWLQMENENETEFERSINTRVLSATLSNKGRDITYVPGYVQQRFMPLEVCVCMVIQLIQHLGISVHLIIIVIML